MAAKDFTDYVALILEAEKRVYHVYHFRARDTKDVEEIEHNGQSYIFERDRAYWVKWAPWKKWDAKRPIWSLKELFRSKKIGLLLFHERKPTDPELREVAHEVLVGHTCKLCPFETQHERAARAHVTRMHKGAKFEVIIIPKMQTVTETVKVYRKNQPIHLSRMHQPSGKLIEDGAVV